MVVLCANCIRVMVLDDKYAAVCVWCCGGHLMCTLQGFENCWSVVRGWGSPSNAGGERETKWCTLNIEGKISHVWRGASIMQLISWEGYPASVGGLGSTGVILAWQILVAGGVGWGPEMLFWFSNTDVSLFHYLKGLDVTTCSLFVQQHIPKA